MSDSPLLVRKAAVLGAGVMGAQIAAHLVNAGVPVLLFDLPAKEGDPNGLVAQGDRQPRQARARAARGEGRAPRASRPRNYDSDLALLARLRPRDRGDRRAHGLEARPVREGRAASRAARDPRDQHVGPVARRAVATRCREALRPRFCGVHFFNPPRYMHLVELIPAPRDRRRAARRARGVPDHDARQGRRSAPRTRRTSSPTASACSRCWRRCTTRERFGLGFDVVDALTGPAIGRPKSATYRTADVVGLDTMAHVIKTMGDTLPDDPWHALFAAPPVLAGAGRARARSAQKTQARLLSARSARTSRCSISRRGDYRLVRRRGRAGSRRDPRRSRDPREKFAQAARERASAGAVPVGDLPRPLPLQRVPPRDDRRQRARRRSRDPLGLRLGAGAVRDLAGGGLAARSPTGSPRTSPPARRWRACRCPTGSTATRSRGAAACTRAAGAYSPARDAFVPRSTLPVYARQRFPDPVLRRALRHAARRCSRPTRVRMWHLGDDIAHRLVQDQAEHDRRRRARRPAARDRRSRAQLRGPGDLADERAVLARRRSRGDRAGDRRPGSGTASRRWSRKFQQTAHAAATTAWCRPSPRSRHGARRRVRIHHALRPHGRGARDLHRPGRGGVGLLPAGGGCKEIARARRGRSRSAARAAASSTCSRSCARTSRRSRWRRSRRARSRRRSSAICAPADVVDHEPATSCCTSPRRRRARWPKPATGRRCRARSIPVAGKTGIATLHDAAGQHARRRLHLPHDFEIGSRIASVLCGGEVEPAAWSTRSGCSSSSAATSWRCCADREDAGAHRAHAQDRQAAAQLRQLSRHEPSRLQDAYIVAATRTPVGKAPRGVFRNTRPDTLLAHVLRSVLAQAPAIDPARDRRRDRRLRDARGRAGHERRAHRRAARRPAGQRAGHDDQPLLLVGPARRCRSPPTASASARPT